MNSNIFVYNTPHQLDPSLQILAPEWHHYLPVIDKQHQLTCSQSEDCVDRTKWSTAT